MKIPSSWHGKQESILPTSIMVGYFTNEPPHGSVEVPVLINQKEEVFNEEQVEEIDLFLANGLTIEAQELIDAGLKKGYKLIPRDGRQMPAPKMNLRLRVVSDN
jgi:hypothetical protein